MPNKFQLPFLSGILLTALALMGTRCGETPDPLQSNYPAEVEAILVNTCAQSDCHAGPNPSEELDLSNWSAAHIGSDFGAVIIPGNHNWSHLFQHINTFSDLGISATPVMPPDPNPTLSRSQVETIRDWINTGAPNKEGRRYWEEQETRTNGKLFALCANSDLIAVADLASNLVMRFIPVGQFEEQLEAPHYVRSSPDGQFIYVTLIGGALVEKYRTDNYEFVGRVSVGSDPAIIYLNENGTRALVTHWNDAGGSPKLTLLNTENMTIIDQVIGGSNLLSFPHGLVVNQDFTKAYVTANKGNYVAVVELDESGFTGIERFAIDPAVSPSPGPSNDYEPYQIYMLPDESKLFVSLSKTDEVRVFDAQTYALLKTIPVGRYPRLMDYDPVSQRLFVACRFEENFPAQGSLEGCVSVIDVPNLSFVQNIYNVGHRPHGVGVAANGRRLYVSSENTGGVDPPHHPIQGNSFPPGKYNVVDLNTLEVLKDLETEIAEYPNAVVVME